MFFLFCLTFFVFSRKFFFICFIYFSVFTSTSFADFLSICGLSSKDIKNVDYVLKNSNSNFIPHQIDEINNDTFQQALYLLSFYKDGKAAVLPDDMIDIIGVDVVRQISDFKYRAIEYLLKTSHYNEDKFRKIINDFNLGTDDFLFILKNKYFQLNFVYKDTAIKYLLSKVFNEKKLSSFDFDYLISKYNQYITDKMILQQIRFRFFYKNDVDFEIKKLIKNKSEKEHAEKIEYFYKIFNADDVYKTGAKNKIKNGKKKYICNTLIGYDEYIDLVCLEDNKKNTEIVKNILSINLNPSFLPSKWLFYRRIYVYKQINQGQITYNLYSIISNSGILYNNDYYEQQFLSGFVAFLNKDYKNAVLHFTECSKFSIFTDDIAKAYYWLGLSYKRLGDDLSSMDAFVIAKKYVFTMYGQIAASEVGDDIKKNIMNYFLSFKKNNTLLCKDVNFVIGYLEQRRLKSIGLSSILASYVMNNFDQEKLLNALDVIKSDFKEKSANAFGFYALRFNALYNNIGFPIIKYTDDSLVNAVIKKETNFKYGVIGSSGELGIMQIMPSTARMVAKKIGIKYDSNKLLYNDGYNVRIGEFYLKKLLHQFDGNEILALASYNAGSGNVKKWISYNGDPREMSLNEENAEWIEKIPFFYTKKYIVNILGFKTVYDVVKAMNYR